MLKITFDITDVDQIINWADHEIITVHKEIEIETDQILYYIDIIHSVGRGHISVEWFEEITK